MEYLERLRKEKENKHLLPYKFGVKFYPWQHEIFHSRNHDIMFTAANQCGKSSIMIMKNIHWGIEKDLWQYLWPSMPTQFWYFYPDWTTATREFEERWIKEFLPRGKLSDDPYYGWEHKMRRGVIYKLSFASTLNIYFGVYTQDLSNMQAGSVYMLSLDEECPIYLWHELNARRSGINVNGYMMQGFTATLGQEEWRLAINPEPGEEETFKHAWKRSISLYDCMKYHDGTDSAWTLEEIQKREERCTSKAEKDRRIYGKFATEKDVRYYQFKRRKHFVKAHPVPEGWTIWVGIDIGSGGQTSHPAAIVFVAVDPNFIKGRVIKVWRGDKMETTSNDILKKYQQMRGSMKPIGVFYDWQSKDFFKVCQGANEFVQPAEKSRDMGEDLINTLFKYDMLQIYDHGEGDESIKLVVELEMLRKVMHKSSAKDDCADALRYAITKIPWNFENVEDREREKPDGLETPEERRRRLGRRLKDWTEDDDEIDTIDMEIDLANEAYEYYEYEEE